MKLKFKYDRAKDVWCLVNKGKSSNNSPNPTKQYEQLVAVVGENASEESVVGFIDQYLAGNNIDIDGYVAKYQADWEAVAAEYKKIAEEIFKVSLPSDISAYLTINSRCPYSIQDNYFYVSVPTQASNLTVMHELWHFYTWYGLGADQEEKIGQKKYNDLKEALTVLLNIECADLLPEGVQDKGYPQHQDLRAQITEFWGQEKDIRKLWGIINL